MIFQFEERYIEVIENKDFLFLMSSEEVAKGYGVSEDNIRMQKSNHKDELHENNHYVTLNQNNAKNFNITLHPKVRQQTFWTKRGVIRLGFFIKSERAKKFRDWSENLILNGGESSRTEKESEKLFKFVEMIEGEPRISHCIIAGEIEVKEKLIRNTITKHIDQFEFFGKIVFEEEERFNSVGAINMKRIYFLNEQQSFLLLTFSRNSQLLTNFKVLLVDEFYKFREKIELLKFEKIQNQKFRDFESVEDLKKHRKFNKELIKFIKLLSSQDEKTLIHLDKLYKSSNQKSPVEIFNLL
jgi:phage regulator Rha-like protein